MWTTELDSSLKRKQIDWMVIMLLGAMALSCAWIYRNFAQDDAFITFRYARNISEGHGFVYNVNEPVLGTTTPLYTLVLALFGKLSQQDLWLGSHLLSILSLWISSILLYDLGKHQGDLQAAAVSFIFMSNPLLISAIGMETFFLIAIMLIALKSYLAHKLNVTGTLLGLLLLTRYETALFAMLLGGHFMIKHRRLPVWLVFTLLVCAPWFIFAWHTFGQIIPQSALAKMIELSGGAGYSFATGAIIWWHVYGLQAWWYYLFLPVILLGCYSALRIKRPGLAYTLILVWTAVYGFAASFVASSFSWYYGPLIPGFSILLVWGVEWLVRFVSILFNFLEPKNQLFRGLQTGAFVSITLAIVGLQWSSWTQGWVTYQGEVVDARYASHREVAEWLNENAHVGESLVVGEIGILGYYTHLKIIDLHGLVSPDLLPWLGQGDGGTLEKAIEIYAPIYLLFRGEAKSAITFNAATYEPVQSFGNDAFTLYKRTCC